MSSEGRLLNELEISGHVPGHEGDSLHWPNVEVSLEPLEVVLHPPVPQVDQAIHY